MQTQWITLTTGLSKIIQPARILRVHQEMLPANSDRLNPAHRHSVAVRASIITGAKTWHTSPHCGTDRSSDLSCREVLLQQLPESMALTEAVTSASSGCFLAPVLFKQTYPFSTTHAEEAHTYQLLGAYSEISANKHATHPGHVFIQTHPQCKRHILGQQRFISHMRISTKWVQNFTSQHPLHQPTWLCASISHFKYFMFIAPIFATFFIAVVHTPSQSHYTLQHKCRL